MPQEIEPPSNNLQHIRIQWTTHSLYMSHPRQLIFLRKSDCLRCAVLLCFVVYLTLLASFFLPSHLSLKHVYTYMHTYVIRTCIHMYSITIHLQYMYTYMYVLMHIHVHVHMYIRTSLHVPYQLLRTVPTAGIDLSLLLKCPVDGSGH